MGRLLEVLKSPEWHEHALCRDQPQEVFYGHEQREGTRRHRPTMTVDEVRYAKSFCQECPVAAQCLEAALEGGEVNGVWGGTTPNERRAIWKHAYERRK